MYKEEVNPRSKFKSVNKLLVELKKLIIVYWENLYHAQEFQNKLIIRDSSLEAISLIIKFG